MKVFLLAVLPLLSWGFNDDLFNYGGTDESARDYGPRDWNRVECDDTDTCTGWPERWQFALDWRFRDNDCRNCEEADACGTHHQSPIYLERRWGENKQINDEGLLNCGDNHWMKYESGTCTWDHLVEANAITVERHTLTIAQPVEADGNDWRLNCLTQGRGRLFSRLDMSGGFSQWWWLNHVEIKMPSEHVQEGKRYAGEVQMGHFYSRPQGVDNGSWNQMATISVFLDESDEVQPYPFLDKLICQWRHYEDKVRKECGMGSVETPYPGCFNNERPETAISRAANTTRTPNLRRRMVVDDEAPEEEKRMKLQIDPGNYRPPDYTEEEWAVFQEEYSHQHPVNSTHSWINNRQERHLIDYAHVPYFNHQFLLDCRTEYYFRYEGTATIPPCYGHHSSSAGQRDRTNVWRVMKEPIRIHSRQVKEMHRLLRERIAPPDALRNACQPDTAAKVEEDGSAWVARPLQATDAEHDTWFCECEDWGSKVPEDKAWCQSGEREYRWFTNPYNYQTGGVF